MGIALTDLVSATISASSASPTVPGFGKTLFMANKVPAGFPGTPQTYTGTSGMIAAGFLTTDDAFLAASSSFNATPAAASFMVASRTNKTTQVIKLQCKSAVVNTAYPLTVTTPAGVATSLAYTVANPTLTASAGCTLTFAAAGHTITRSTGSFLTDGWAVGQTPTIAGTTSNNGAAPSAISALTPTVMTFTSGIVNEGPLSATANLTATQTTSGVANAFLALLNAVTGFSGSTVSTDTITVASPAAGTLNGFSGWGVGTSLYLTDTSTDPGVAADLATAIAGDNTWYGLALDSQSKAEILAAAAFAETNKKLFVTQTYESTVIDSGVSNDVASSVQTSAYHYTGMLFSGTNTKSYAGVAWQSGRFGGSPTPGNDTWVLNTLPGIPVDNLTETQFATLGNKFATGYVNIQGVNVTASGGIANSNSGGKNGFGEFLDVRRFQDWLLSQIQLGIYIALLGPGKVAYTDKGLGSLANAVLAALQRGEQAQGLVAGSSVVSQPTAASQSTSDRGNRIIRALNWAAVNAGAVHLVVSSGTVTT